MPSECNLTPLWITNELTDTDRENYAGFMNYMTAHTEQRLWDLPSEKQSEIRAQFQRLYPPVLSPAFICHMSTGSNTTYLVYIEAQQHPAIPDQVLVKTHIVSTNFPDVLRVQEFSAGWRTCIDGFAVDHSHRNEFGDLLRIDIITGLPMNAGKARMFLAIHEPEKDADGYGEAPEFVLLRIEGETGNIGSTVYGKYYNHGTRGPVAAFCRTARSVDDFKILICTRDRVQVLATLLYLAGTHADVSYSANGLPYQVENRLIPSVLIHWERDQTLSKLRRHKSPWIKETAQFLWDKWNTSNKTPGYDP
jgi:hypothetical protein